MTTRRGFAGDAPVYSLARPRHRNCLNASRRILNARTPAFNNIITRVISGNGARRTNFIPQFSTITIARAAAETRSQRHTLLAQ
jgi:hypothetical protein